MYRFESENFSPGSVFIIKSISAPPHGLHIAKSLKKFRQIECDSSEQRSIVQSSCTTIRTTFLPFIVDNATIRRHYFISHVYGRDGSEPKLDSWLAGSKPETRARKNSWLDLWLASRIFFLGYLTFFF